MNHPVLKITALGIMLVALWLVLEGIWNALGLYATFSSCMNAQISSIAVVLIVIWQILPLLVGTAMLKARPMILAWFCRAIEPEKRNQIDWNDSHTLSSFAFSLLGMVFLARGIARFCEEHLILWWIVGIDDSVYWRQYLDASDRLSYFIPIVYPVFLGLALLAFAPSLGHLIGKRIDRSVELALQPTDDENVSEDKEAEA